MPDIDINKVASDTAAAVTELKTSLEKRDADIKKHGEVLGETEAKFEAMNDTLCDLAQMKTRLETIETTMKRPEFQVFEDATDATKAKLEEYHRAYWAVQRTKDWQGEVAPEWARKATLDPPDEVKVLIAGDDTLGGYLLAPPEFVQQIITPIDEFSPIRPIASVRTTSRERVQIPKRTAVFSSVWVAESGTRSETTGLTFGLEDLPTHEETAQVNISWQDLEDSGFNIEAYVSEQAAMQFNVGESDAFVNGTGIGKPYGFVTQLTAESRYTALGAASSFTSLDGFIDLQHAVKVGYGPKVWGMRRATIGILRKCKGGDGHYLWEPSSQVADPMNFLGDTIVEMPDMPAVTTNTYSVVYGDFKAGYQIVDRLGIQVIRDPFSSKATGAVEFLFRKRVGGAIVLSEALRLGRVATS